MAGLQVATNIQEIVDLVVDYFHDDPEALGKLSLVSHVWCNAARRWLFYSIKLKNWGSRHFNLKAFAELISSSPSIARSVAVLTLHGGDEPIRGRFLGTVLSKLTRLMSLAVLRSRICGKLVLDGEPCPLRELAMWDISDGDCRCTLPQLLNLFPNLERLSLRSIGTAFARGTVRRTEPYLRLSELNILEPTNQLMILLQRTVVSCTALIVTLYPSTYKSTGVFIRNIAPSLDFLLLVFASDSNVTDYDELDFEPCVALRSVVFAGPSGWRDDAFEKGWDEKLEILQRLPATIKHLGIEVSPQISVASIETQIARLQPILSRCFTQLQRIAFGPSMNEIADTVRFYTKGPATELCIRRALRDFDHLGILEWRCPFDPVRVSNPLAPDELCLAIYLSEDPDISLDSDPDSEIFDMELD